MCKFPSVLVFTYAFILCHTKDYSDKLDRYLIACHSTDFLCFQRQYRSFRDHFLLGSNLLNIKNYAPYYMKYGDSGTCIRISGLEESQLVGIQMESVNHLYSLTMELPFKIQQVASQNTNLCTNPEHEFVNIGPQTGPLRKFTGNATIKVVYPYGLRKKKGEIHMNLGEEDLDVILDIPDLEDFKDGDSAENELYELSEWAYEVIQHIDAAHAFALPFTSRFKNITNHIPLNRFLLLYPEEEYTQISFKFSESQFDSTEFNNTVET